jgi:hypothetical protein
MRRIGFDVTSFGHFPLLDGVSTVCKVDYTHPLLLCHCFLFFTEITKNMATLRRYPCRKIAETNDGEILVLRSTLSSLAVGDPQQHIPLLGRVPA